MPVFKAAFLLGFAPENLVIAVGVEWRIDVDQINAGAGKFPQLFKIIAAVNNARVNESRRLAGHAYSTLPNLRLLVNAPSIHVVIDASDFARNDKRCVVWIPKRSFHMAKVFGAAGEHAGRQSVAAFKRMFLTLLFVVIVAAFCEGVVLTALITTVIKTNWIGIALALAVGVFLWWLSRYAGRRVDEHETNRLNWRKGALGEYEVGAELERLSDDYVVFNNLNTAGFGNFDHIVLGPTGLFAIETKNWSGFISANASGELKKNDKDSSIPHVRMFFRRAMELRDQIVTLTHSNDAHVRCVMVFPKAHVEAQFGSTGHVYCMPLSQLHDYIADEKFSQKLSPKQMDRFVRALHGIAGMDEEFSPQLPAESFATD